jgi:prefoldin subunit 5
MKRFTAVAIAIALYAAPSASARVVVVSGHVLAPPAASGPSVSVPVLLTRGSERRLRAGTPIVRLLVRRRARVTAPRPFGSGRVRIKPGQVRAGDRFASRLLVNPAMLRRARHQRMPALRLTARASTLSTDELTQLVLSLQAQLAALTRRIDDLSAKQASDLSALQAQLAALTGRVSALETGLAQLQGALGQLDTELQDRIDQLDGDVGDLAARLTAVEQDVAGLLTQVAALQGAVGTLQTDLAGVQA